MEILDDAHVLLRGKRIVVLTGAGVSTDSGIPDYRGPLTRAKARNPIQYREFLTDASARQRYWARSARGWPRINATHPNEIHTCLAALEERGIVSGIITQNVDRLHHRAGSRRVVELHGALEEVECLSCFGTSPRLELQTRMLEANPRWHIVDGEMAPDGDMDLDDELIASFSVPVCEGCDGDLKPKVVFFGESVPKKVTDSAWSLYDEAEVLLIAGSSLAVYSGLRFPRRAAEDGKPVLIFNRGETRGDNLATLKIDGLLTETLVPLAKRLS